MCLKMVSTPKPNGFADHYPYEKWLAIIGKINPTFSVTNPFGFGESLRRSPCVVQVVQVALRSAPFADRATAQLSQLSGHHFGRPKHPLVSPFAQRICPWHLSIPNRSVPFQKLTCLLFTPHLPRILQKWLLHVVTVDYPKIPKYLPECLENCQDCIGHWSEHNMGLSENRVYSQL